ncbi:UPF0149 family protein [Aquirhabdus parva]|uniref:YecA family protein n=1 Tax=Aquirhabdus parva TaxID=2283318 RepID=A0A345P585_9GAMM|nr:UPF0149 family protein [Aquirhabdus parva]AXI02444.1 YecA family protein [Aquirhabdus parva]
MHDDESGWTEWDGRFSKVPDLSGPSELHGLLTGIVVVTQPPTSDEWQAILARIGFEPLPEDALRLLTEEAEDTAAALQDDTLDYAPLLPDDDHPLIERVEALANWCSGVLLGFGLTGGRIRKDEAEILHSLSDVAGLLYSDEDDDEEGEESYTDLVEFVRLIPVSLALGRERSTVASTSLLTGKPLVDAQGDALDHVDSDHDHAHTEGSDTPIVEHFNPARPS